MKSGDFSGKTGLTWMKSGFGRTSKLNCYAVRGMSSHSHTPELRLRLAAGLSKLDAYGVTRGKKDNCSYPR
jgi:hypothetical protein